MQMEQISRMVLFFFCLASLRATITIAITEASRRARQSAKMEYVGEEVGGPGRREDMGSVNVNSSASCFVVVVVFFVVCSAMRVCRVLRIHGCDN